MKSKCLSLLMALVLVLSLCPAGTVLAGSAPLVVTVENPQPSDQTDNSVSDQEGTDITLNDQDLASPVTDEPESDIENSDPAPDITGAQNLDEDSSSADEALKELQEAAGPVDSSVYSSKANPLHNLLQQIKKSGRLNSGQLVELSRCLLLIAKNQHRERLEVRQEAERSLVLMTDATVRLAAKTAPDNIRLIVYRNAAQTYALLGCYRRAAGVLEQAAGISPNRAGIYQDLLKLYKKSGNKDLKLFIKGKKPDFEGTEPVKKEGRTLVPLRVIAQGLGAQVNWNPQNRSVNIVKGDVNINLTIDNNTSIVNGRKIQLDVPATIINGRTMVPLRFISQSLGSQVNYDNDTQTITIE